MPNTWKGEQFGYYLDGGRVEISAETARELREGCSSLWAAGPPLVIGQSKHRRATGTRAGRPGPETQQTPQAVLAEVIRRSNISNRAAAEVIERLCRRVENSRSPQLRKARRRLERVVLSLEDAQAARVLQALRSPVTTRPKWTSAGKRKRSWHREKRRRRQSGGSTAAELRQNHRRPDTGRCAWCKRPTTPSERAASADAVALLLGNAYCDEHRQQVIALLAPPDRRTSPPAS
jgi:hypothetical protein